MDVEYKKFVREVREGKIRHGYLLLGENEFLKECLIRDIESKIIKPEFIATDKLVVHGEAIESDVVSWLDSPPFGSKKKLLLIKNADALSQKIRNALQKWLVNPSRTAVLVLMANKNGFKSIPTCKCWKLSESEIPEWVMGFVEQRGFSIEQEAIGFLQQIFGTEIQALASELEKLVSYVAPSKVITLMDAEAMESQEITGSIFDLAHAVANRDLDKAERMVKLLFELGGKPNEILWKIYDHFDKLIKLKNSPEELHGIHKYYLPKYRQEATLWSESELLSAFSCMFEADLAIKTGKAKADFVLYELIYKLCGRDEDSASEQGRQPGSLKSYRR